MKNNKNIIISIISLLVLVIIGLIIYIILLNNKLEVKDEKEIEASVLLVGDDYLLVTDDNEQDYIINYDSSDLESGDVVKFKINNIDTSKDPIEADLDSYVIIEENNVIDEDISLDYEDDYIDIIDDEEDVTSNSIDNDNNYTTDNNVDNINQDNYTEEDVINYFDGVEEKLTNYKEGSSDELDVKDKFVKVVDFIFYDGEIGGRKFGELTSSAKLKVISIALSIDSKIDNKFPGYKDTISSKYKNIKNKLIEKYLEITTSICKKDAELCVNAKEGFKDLKSSFGITWDIIKSLASNGITKLKDWYEIWRYN